MLVNNTLVLQDPPKTGMFDSKCIFFFYIENQVEYIWEMVSLNDS